MKSNLHLTAVMDDKSWHSLPPHIPVTCYGTEPCPESSGEQCTHNHESSRAAFNCSRNRPIEKGVGLTWKHQDWNLTVVLDVPVHENGDVTPLEK